MNKWIIIIGTAWVSMTLITVLLVQNSSTQILPEDHVALCAIPTVNSETPSLTTYFTSLLTTSKWPARWTCGDWSKGEGWMYIISDLTIFLSYLSIPIMLLWYVRNQVLGKLRWIIALFGAFILLCGITHLIDAIMFWEPVYRLSGFSKLLTGLVSMTTAVVLGFVIPGALQYRSPQDLQKEIDRRKEIQNQFELFVKHSPGAIAMVDEDMRYMMANDGWYVDYGIEGKEIIGKSHYEVFPAIKSMPEWLDYHKRALSGEIIRKDFDQFGDGENRIYLRWELRPWHDANDKIGGIIMFTEMITNELVLKEKLESKSNEANRLVHTLSRIGQVANIGVWEVDVSKNLCYWDETVYRIHEVDPSKEILVENGINYYKTEDQPIISSAVQACIEKGQPWDLELRIITETGIEKWVRAVGTCIKENGEVTKLKGLFQDIDKRKRAEILVQESEKKLIQKVEERTKSLKRANDELEAFSYSVSHDLRAPLRAINGYAEALIEDCKGILDDTGERYLSRIGANSRKMGVLIDDLLEFSRMNRKKADFVEIDLGKKVHHLVKDLFNENKQDIRIGELPIVFGDKELLAQVFTNLISNAIKYSSKEEKQQIEISSDDKGEHYVISVSDNGVGFNTEYADKLFKVFQRLHSESEFEGTGVGLALCQKIIRMHDGEIWADSQLGMGSTFFIKLKKKQ